MKIIKLHLLSFLSFATLSSISYSSEIENQCLSEAKIIALKSYESCVTGKKAEQVEALKQEYQERALQLKSEYENKIKNLNEIPEASPVTSESTNELQQHTEPTVTLKPASKAISKKTNSSTPKKSTKAKKEIIKSNLKSAQLKSPKIIQKAELNEITGESENLEMLDPSLEKE